VRSRNEPARHHTLVVARFPDLATGPTEGLQSQSRREQETFGPADGGVGSRYRAAVLPGNRPMFHSEFAKPPNNAETRADLLVLIHEAVGCRLQIHHLAEGQVRPTRLSPVLDLMRAIVRRYRVGDKLQVIFQRTARTTRDRSPQPQSAGRSAVDRAGTLAELVSSRRRPVWLLIHVATACTVTLPHPGRLPKSL
jgi:hypothetical protein